MDTTQQRADALVMFGLAGDLGDKKLFPALSDLARADRLDLPVIGVGRTEYTDDEMRARLRASLGEHGPSDDAVVDDAILDAIDLSYQSGDATETSFYDELADRLGEAEYPVVYAALPPELFADVATGIARSTLPDTTRLVVEKPFGTDADSARDLYDEIVGALGHDRLLIVDHFLAKSAIENMLTVRTANALIDNSMCSQYVESIDIVMAESGGVDGRGSFYESVGAIDDVLQNHLLQMMAVLLMEAPADDSDAAYHRARCELLAAVRPFAAGATVLGQYDGYRELDDVADDSDVETFVAVTTTVDNDRWRDVPITIRTGKRLADDVTRATITLRPNASAEGAPNRIVFSVKPDASVMFDLGVLDPESHEVAPVSVEVCTSAEHGPLGDYAVMLDNAMSGETRHFAQIDGIVAAWRVVDPIHIGSLTLHGYEPGSDGPPTPAFWSGSGTPDGSET